MPAFVRRPLFALIVLCSLACLSLPAIADSVSVSGTAYGGSDTNGLSVMAGIFSTVSAAPFGYSQVGGGTAGIPVKLSFKGLLPLGVCSDGRVYFAKRLAELHSKGAACQAIKLTIGVQAGRFVKRLPWSLEQYPK